LRTAVGFYLAPIHGASHSEHDIVDSVQRRAIADARIDLVQGDITRQDTDAIVNAANTRLAGGGGVDGAIHRAGGPGILAECRQIGGCPTGDARITRGGTLPARWVIHAVGPVYRDGRHGEAALLESAYQRSLEVAVEHALRSVAFPSISTGAYGYPIAAAAGVAVGTVARFMTASPRALDLVRFVLFSAADLAVYEAALAGVAG
jgi:O-acetyl-ADP-ribose deacetylase (regulator of RNase III)